MVESGVQYEQGAFFVDRDNTLIEDKAYTHMHNDGEACCIEKQRNGGTYLHKPTELTLFDNVIDAIKRYQDLGYLTMIITDQVGIGRSISERKTWKD